MFDIQATIRWVTEVLKDPQSAAASYKQAAAPWKQSFLQITLPAYVAGSVFGYVLALITGGSFLYGGVNFGFFLFALLWSLGWTFVIAFIFDYLAGMFDGTRNFDSAYAIVALAIVPAALGTGLGPLPWFGWLISLAASIYSIVLAYRFVPVFLQVPEVARVKHFVLSVVAALVVNILVSATVGSMFAPAMVGSYSDREPGGMLEHMERQAELTQAAADDVYVPPENGKLSREQVADYADVMQKTSVLRERLTSRYEDLDEDDASFSDVFGGMNDAMRLSTVEMEAVKSAGGNWAEHLWVKRQVEIARVQRDSNDAVRHNHQLYLEFQDTIDQHR